MSTAIRRVLAMSLATALMLALVALIAAQAGATTNQTCKDVGFQNLETSTSGPWGSVTFSDDEPTLELTVAAGYEVRLCVKAGSAEQGLGPEVSDWLDEGQYSMTHTSGKDLSHYGLIYRTVTTTTQPEDDDEDTTTTSTLPDETTTTQPDETTSTVPEETTTTVSETTTTAAETTTTAGVSATTAPRGPTTEPAEADVLPFTGIDDWLAPVAAVLALGGWGLLSAVRRSEEVIDDRD